jgi:DNA polymerase III alpha subunit
LASSADTPFLFDLQDDIPPHPAARAAIHPRSAGCRITGKEVRTKAGDPMAFPTVEEETGFVETTFFPKTDDRFRHHIDHGRPYLPGGKVEQNRGATPLTVSHVRALSG